MSKKYSQHQRHIKKWLYIYIIMCAACFTPNKSNAQIRTGYFIESNVMRHDINPALQPDSGYISLPLLGNTAIGIQSTVGLDALLFDNADGTLTTFMSNGTISKADLMNKIGSGMKTNATAQLTLLSIGQRINRWRYWTASLSIKTDVNAWVPKGLFDCMKDIENRDYNIGDIKGRGTAYAEIAVGESSHWTERLDIGGKVKLLVGLMNADVKTSGLRLNTKGESEWTVSGTAETNVAGLKYTTEEKSYDSRPGTYRQVDGVRLNGVKPCGIGVAIDLGMAYKIEDRLTLSAAVTDLGFITWTGNHKAKNTETSFNFNGFHNVEVDKEDENSLKNQWDRISDDLMDLAHLEETDEKSHTQMLGATLTAGAEYDMSSFNNIKLGALLTHRINGKFSWTEFRASGVFAPKCKLPLSITVSPAYSTFGVAIGMMGICSPSKTTTFFIGSDYLFFKVNPQMIPTSLNGNVSLGMTILL